jgi:phytoene synthase
MKTGLEASYRDCCRLARRAAKNFYYAFWTLPRDKRRSMCALYAFFRRTDDLGDEDSVPSSAFRVQGSGLEEGVRVEESKSVRAGGIRSAPGLVLENSKARRAALGAWRESLRRALGGTFDDRLLPALVDTVRRYAIPIEYLETAIDGVESDLDRTTFATFDELTKYCYQVASVVGLSCVQIWGFRPEAAAYEAAHQCGVAFQMTNILRDVAEDAARGRIYLPQEDLTRFGVRPEAIRAGVVDNAWRALMQFEADRIETYYRRARELTAYLEPDGVRIYGAMLDIYYGLFQEIRRRDGDVFSRRVRLSTWRKLTILLAHLRPGRARGEASTAIGRAPMRGGAG